MHIIYIEFGISKSKQYSKACELAKRLPNYTLSKACIKCWIDDVKSFIIFQNEIRALFNIVNKWKSANIEFYGNKYKSMFDYYDFLDELKSKSGKYEPVITSNRDTVALGSVTYEDLPLPFIYYPELYGAFFAFCEDIGKQIYFCECERTAIENYIKLKRNNQLSKHDNYPLSPRYFPKTISQISISYKENPIEAFDFKPNICFRCNNKLPSKKFCHQMYGGKFKQNYGWYMEQEKLKLGLDYRILEENNISLEDFVREQLGFPKVGEAWISETLLFKIIKRLYPNYEVLRHYRPKWLEGLELDIYIPQLKMAFEYQGIQHFKAIKHWGGTEQLKKQQEHDERKKKICDNLKILLICVNYDEELTEEHVKNKITLSMK